MFLHEAKQILRTFLLLRPCSPENSKKKSSHVLDLAVTPCSRSVQCILITSCCHRPHFLKSLS